jgi:hypothetical protein
LSAERQEYEAALAAYAAAQARLIEAKRHYDPKTAPEVIEQRKAKQATYRAKRKAEWNAPEAKAQRERELEESRERTQRLMEEYERRWRVA